LVLIIACLVFCLTGTAAMAGGATALTLVSDYDFRGETQTQSDPAGQLTLEWVGRSGWKGGVFASNVRFGSSAQDGDPHLELAPYLDFKTSLNSRWRVGAGAAYYGYMLDGGGTYDYPEGYFAVEYRALRAALYYAPDYSGRSTPGRSPAWYSAFDATTAMPRRWALVEHVGYSWGDYWRTIGGGRRVDYSLGVLRRFGPIDLSAQYIYTQRMPPRGSNAPGSAGRAVLTLTRIFNW
jgi:uncharacterized protein (TIGR02001 family)